jgi:hypothetical protein
MAMPMAATAAALITLLASAAATPAVASTAPATTPAVPSAAAWIVIPTASRGRASRPTAAAAGAAASRRLCYRGEPEPDLKILAWPHHLGLDRLVSGNGTQPDTGGCLAEGIRGRSNRVHSRVGKAIAELEGDGRPGDRVARAIGELHDQGLGNRLADRPALAVTADDRESGGISGPRQHQVLAAAGAG